MTRIKLAAVTAVCFVAGPAVAQAPDLYTVLESYWTERLDGLPEDRSAMAETVVRTCTRQYVAMMTMADTYVQTTMPSAVLAQIDKAHPEDRRVREKLAALVLDRMQTDPTVKDEMLPGLMVASQSGVLNKCYEAALRAMWGPDQFVDPVEFTE